MAHNFNKIYAPFGRLNPKDKLCSTEKPNRSWIPLFYTSNMKMFASEKLDGTSIGIVWDGERISFVGHTEGKPVAKELIPYLEENFGTKQFESVIESVFGETVVTIYGEMLHKNVGSHQYGFPEGKFIGYDICDAEGKYYNRTAVKGILESLGIEHPHEELMTINEAVDFVSTRQKSWLDTNEPLEGLVLRPQIELYLNNNERVICKVKTCDFCKD